MKTIFVTEASQKIGGGHAMRCLTLAGALRRKGTDVSFIVNDEASRFAPALARSDFPIETVTSVEDAARAATRREGVDVVVCDSYAISAPLERLFRPTARKIVMIDDLADRQHDCDLLLDTTYGRSAADYRGLVPGGAVVLAGAGAIDVAQMHLDAGDVVDEALQPIAQLALGPVGQRGLAVNVVVGIQLDLHRSSSIGMGRPPSCAKRTVPSTGCGPGTAARVPARRLRGRARSGRHCRR